MKYVKVKFKEDYTDSWDDTSSNVYLYKVKDNISLRQGDYVVVETKYGLALGIVFDITDVTTFNELASITEYNASDYNKKLVTKIDGYNLYDEMKKQRRIREIKDQLSRYISMVDEQQKYNLVQTMFPETTELIEELNKLNK